MRIYDCFQFYNELDLLEIRLNELNDVIDRFVLVESKRTHQNKDKILYYDENKNNKNLKKFKDKIIHVIVEDSEFNNNYWDNEKLQRKHILDGLDGVNDNDFIIVSDCDEIPSKQAVIKSIEDNQNISSFEQILHYFYLNTQLFVNNTPKNFGSVMLKKSSFESDTEIVRYHNKINYHKIYDGGWHFSFLGDKNKIYNKLQNYAHSEFNHLTLDDVNNSLNNLTDVLNRGDNHKIVLMDDINYLPEYVLNNLEKYEKYIKK